MIRILCTSPRPVSRDQGLLDLVIFAFIRGGLARALPQPRTASNDMIARRRNSIGGSATEQTRGATKSVGKCALVSNKCNSVIEYVTLVSEK